MAHFCNQFDKVCTELGTAVIYCHHHSKGAQGGKRSMDRASGSGVFARDPDALLDLIELEVSDDLRKQIENKAVCAACMAALTEAGKASEASQDDACSAAVMREICQKNLPEQAYLPRLETARKAAAVCTAWRLEGTLREFPRFPTRNMWFDFPIHRLDDSGALADIQAEAAAMPWKRASAKKKTPKEREKERKDSVMTAYEACGIGEKVTINDLAEYMGVSEKTVRRRLRDHGGFWIEDGEIGLKKS